MCGLCGWMGPADLPKAQRLRRARAMEGLLVANAERGKDASGVAILDTENHTLLYKRAIPSTKLVGDPALNAAVRTEGAQLVIGHTRLGTMGANVDKNAHPFDEPNVIGAHNGMIYNYNELDYLTTTKEKVRVDSQVIFRLLSDNACDGEVIAQILPMIHGSLALTWIDRRDPGGLWVFKHQNPLNMAVAEAVQTAFWSSEYRHLAVVMQAVYGGAWWGVVIKEDTLYRFHWENGELLAREWSVDMPNEWQRYMASGKDKGTDKYRKEHPLLSAIDDQFPMLTTTSPSVTELNNEIQAGKTDWDSALENCGMCHNSIDWEDDIATWHNVGEGFMLCGPCERWWETNGSLVYGDNLENAISVKAIGRQNHAVT